MWIIQICYCNARHCFTDKCANSSTSDPVVCSSLLFLFSLSLSLFLLKSWLSWLFNKMLVGSHLAGLDKLDACPHTHTNTHAHTHTLGFHVLCGHFIDVMMFILFKLYKKSSDAKASKCHLRFSCLSSVISLKWQW